MRKKVRVAYGCLGNLVYHSWYFIYCGNAVDYVLHALAWNWSFVGGLIALFAPEALLLQVVAGAIVSLTLTFFTKRISKNFREAKGFTDTVDMLVGKKGIVYASDYK